MTTTLEVRLAVEFYDPFGTPIGHGEIVVQPETYADMQMSGRELTMIQTALKVGQYVQADAPDPRLPFSMRVSAPD